jgi:uncharacterized membrane-anchored protein
MNNRNIILPLLIILVIVQLYVPVKMILAREEILTNGAEYKFKTAPLDPVDPFRGKYISLQFENNTIISKSDDDWINGQEVYVILTEDEKGYAKIRSVKKEVPSGELVYVKAAVRYSTSANNVQNLVVDYPFNRYYMEESKAYKAEQVYRKSLQDTSRVTCALVCIKDGEAVLKDILIDGKPIRELAGAANPQK